VEEQTDSTFIRNISIVLAILILAAISIAFIARDVGFKEDQGNNPASVTHTEDRIKPVADVYTGEDGAAAIQQAATTVAPEQSAAFDGSLDGQMIYNNVCSACHSTGAVGAPIPGSEAMAQRAAKGMDGLMQSTLNGLNTMPARGGRSDLSDEQIQAVVEFMTQ
jgi:cytochrome c5